MSLRIALVLLASSGCLVGSAAHAQEPCGAPAETGPSLHAATPVVPLVEGATVCACGSFPDRAALEGLRVDGRPVAASADAFGRVATLRLPPGLAPGAHTISGAPEAGYGAEDRAELRLVKLTLERADWIPFGRGRRLRVEVHGTEEPLELRLENQNPSVFALRGGPLLEVKTSGGPRNRAIVRGRMTGRPGQARVTTSLSAPACPCAGGSPGGLPPDRVAELESCLASAVAELRAWFEGRARELARRAERGPLAPGEVVALLDDLERRLLRVLATPDLAALRAWVEDELAREREASSGGAAPGAVPGSGFRRTSLASTPRTGTAEATTVESLTGFLGRMWAFFDRLDEVSDDLAVDLCVRSVPSGPKVWLHPKRYPVGTITPQSTDTEFLNLSRGIYSGGAEDLGPSPLFEVDLVRRFRVYVLCDLGTSPECRDRDRPAGLECIRNGDG